MGGLKYHVVTTMNATGWKQTGRRMVASFMDRWPEDAKPLTIYAEGFWPDVTGVAVRALPAWLDEFKGRHCTPDKNGFRTPGAYSYRYDAVRFAHKVAAITDYGAELSDGVMVWLDADTFTHASVSVDWLAKLFPPPAYIAWLDRLNCYPECGVMMFRCSHPYHHPFLESFRDLYASDRLFALPETHDSFAIQHLIDRAVTSGKIPRPASLSGAAVRSSHPAANGPLSERMDHLKGERKRTGRTPKEQRYIVRDGNPYWI